MNNTMKLATIGLMIILLSGSPVIAPGVPYPMDGYVVFENGTTVAGANVTFTNLNTTGASIYDDSSSSGYYSNSADNFPSGYSDGDVIQYYTVFGEYTNTTTAAINVSAGYHTMNITLEATTPESPDVQPPTNLQYTTGNFWVHWTWTSGANTDSFNVSINDVWHNGTTSALYNDDGMAAHGWSNISVAGYNATTGNTSSSISQNAQIPNNPPVLTGTGDWSGEVGDTCSVDYGATDADSDTLTFSCSRTDLFTDFNTATGTGSWSPSSTGTTIVTFGVSDGHGGSDSYAMTITTTSFSVHLTAKHSGTEYNDVATTETGANTSFTASTLTGGQDSDLKGEWAASDAPTAVGLWGDTASMIGVALFIGIVALAIGYLRRDTR